MQCFRKTNYCMDFCPGVFHVLRSTSLFGTMQQYVQRIKNGGKQKVLRQYIWCIWYVSYTNILVFCITAVYALVWTAVWMGYPYAAGTCYSPLNTVREIGLMRRIWYYNSTTKTKCRSSILPPLEACLYNPKNFPRNIISLASPRVSSKHQETHLKS